MEAEEPLECVGALILDEQGRIFTQRRSATRKLFPNCWDVVGGHVEPGETPEETLHREVTEETGWEVSAVHAVLDPIRWTGDDGIERLEYDYLVSVTGDLLAPQLEQDKHSEWRWITPAQVSLLDQHRVPGEGLIRELVEQGFAVSQRLGLTPPDSADLGVARFAAALAPVIDRLFLAFMRDARAQGGAELGPRFGMPNAGPLIDYRLILPLRPLRPSERDAVNRYADPEALLAGFEAAAGYQMITLDHDGTATVTARGLEFYAALNELHETVASGRFGSGLLPLLEKVLSTPDISGPAFDAQTPPYLPPNASEGLRVFTALARLRYHRADAHAAAWAAAGLTAAQIAELGPGPERDAIEADTDRRAGMPYGALTPDERLDLLAKLAAC